jgi:Domain of Unknown Function with PDB structure (DUF3857)/Transglutaminase-like superfamily
MAGPAWATDAPQVMLAPLPGWVKPAPPAGEAAPSANAPAQILFSDVQTRVGKNGTEQFTAFRMRILKPQGLEVGNLSLTWRPDIGPAKVHAVRIIRDGQVIDVLRETRFRVIQREDGLEQSIISGLSTALLQVPDLRVGDDLDVAMSIVQRDPTLPDQAFGAYAFPGLELPGTFRFSLSWPEGLPVRLQTSPDLKPAETAAEGDFRQFTMELRDPKAAIATEGAPSRYNIRRLVEYSSFSGWQDISVRFWPLYVEAARLAPDSPIKAEARRIMAETGDPAARAMKALRLVQDEIRYVYVGLGTGNLTPASADLTWKRRYGDCKGKTALLLALLGEMGIPAEAVLVNALSDDGLDERLPHPGNFNHIVVRATLGGKARVLDGTRAGDRSLSALPPNPYRWMLPLRQNGAVLERHPRDGFERPQFIDVLSIDASAGFDVPAKVTGQRVLRGDGAFSLYATITALSGADADRQLRGYWQEAHDWVQPESVGWTFDDMTRTLVLSMSASGTVEWDGDGDWRQLPLWRMTFDTPERRQRPPEQDQSAPWINGFPFYRCWATSVKLPPAGKGRMWGFAGRDMKRHVGGDTFWRLAGKKGDLVRVVMSRRADRSEITPQEALAHNAAIPGFRNDSFTIMVTPMTPRGPADFDAALPFADTIDWATDDSPCEPAIVSERPVG